MDTLISQAERVLEFGSEDWLCTESECSRDSLCFSDDEELIAASGRGRRSGSVGSYGFFVGGHSDSSSSCSSATLPAYQYTPT